MARDAKGLTLEPISIRSAKPIVHCFEVRDHEGVLGIDARGEIVELGSGEVWMQSDPSMQGWRFHAVSRSGRFLVFENKGRFRRLETELLRRGERRRLEHGGLLGRNCVDPEVQRTMRAVSLRSRFRAVALQEGIILEGKRGRPLQLLVKDRLLRLEPLVGGVASGEFVSFQAVPEPHSKRLSVATLGRRRVFLDRRGLLHLQCLDGSLAEVTLVLQERNIAGWIATGEVFGPEFFHGGRGTVLTADEVYERYLLPYCQSVEGQR